MFGKIPAFPTCLVFCGKCLVRCHLSQLNIQPRNKENYGSSLLNELLDLSHPCSNFPAPVDIGCALTLRNQYCSILRCT